MSAIKKLASQTAIYGLSSIFGRLVVWGLTPFYTELMGPEEYGIFSDLYQFATYFLVILTFGMETAFFRFSSDEGKKAYSQAFTFVTSLATIFFVLLGLGSSGVAEITGYGQRPELVQMLLFILFMDVVVALPMAKLRYDERPILFAMVSLSTIVLNVGLNLFFYVGLKKTTADYVFISNVVASGYRFALLFLLSLPLDKIWLKLGKFGRKLAGVDILPDTLKPDKNLLKPMISFGFYIMLAGFSGMLNQGSDINFIKRLWPEGNTWAGIVMTGAAMAGILAANKKLAVIISLFTQAFRYAAEPFFFKEAASRDSKVTFAKIFHYFMLAGLSVFLLVGSFAREFVSIKLFGYTVINERYWSGLDAVPILLAAFVLFGAYANISIWYKLTKQVRFGLGFSLAGSALILLLHFLLIPKFGYIGSSIAMLSGYALMVVLVYRMGQRYYPIPYKMGRVGIYVLVVLVAFGLNSMVGDGNIFEPMFWKKLGISLGALAIMGALEKFRPVNWLAEVAAPPSSPKRNPQDPTKGNQMKEEDKEERE